MMTAEQGNQQTTQAVGSEDNSGTIQIPASDVHPALAGATHPDMAQVHTIKVDGKEEQLTTAQLIERAQKGSAAEARFEEASRIQKENATAIASQEDLKAVIEQGDIDAFRRIGEANGVPADQIEEIAARTFDNNDGETDEDVVSAYDQELQGGKGQAADTGPIAYDRLSPDIQRALRTVEQGRMDGIIQKALDNDEKLSYNMKRYDAEGQRAIRAVVDEKIRGRLAAHRGDFGDGSRILEEILPEVRELVQALGSPSTRSSLGLGPSPGAGDTEVYPDKVPEHVSSQEGDAFEQNILETLAYHHARATQGSS